MVQYLELAIRAVSASNVAVVEYVLETRIFQSEALGALARQTTNRDVLRLLIEHGAPVDDGSRSSSPSPALLHNVGSVIIEEGGKTAPKEMVKLTGEAEVNHASLDEKKRLSKATVQKKTTFDERLKQLEERARAHTHSI